MERRRAWRFPWLALLAVPAVAGWYWLRPQGNGPTAEQLVFAQVGPRKFDVVVRATGTLKSQSAVEFRCQVNRMPGEDGVRIVYLVPNGARVKKGDLVVEFDSEPVKRALDQAYVDHERARARMLQAQAEYESALHAAKASLELAKLELERAQLELSQFEDEHGGTHSLEVRRAELQLQDARNQLVQAQSRLLLQKARLDGILMLYRFGYRQRADVDQARFDYLQAQTEVARAANAVREAEISLKKLRSYDYHLEKLKLQKAVIEARVKLRQLEKENEAKLAQLKAEKDAAEREFAKTREVLRRYENQLKQCWLYAPVDGVVIYSDRYTPWGRKVGPGELVQRPMLIATMPDMKRMQAEVTVHESLVPLVKPGQPARVKLQVAGGAEYPGTVASVADMPERTVWYEEDVKRFKVVVKIDQEVEGVKPGQTVNVTINVKHVDAAVAAPVAAVFQRGDDWWCVVRNPGGALELRKVKVGAIGEEWIEIEEGLEVGEEVALNPEQAPPDLLPPEEPTSDEQPAGTPLATAS